MCKVTEFKETMANHTIDNFLKSGLILSEFLNDKVNEYYNPLKVDAERNVIKLLAVFIKENCQQLLDLIHGEEHPLYDSIRVEDSFPGPYTYQIGVMMENIYSGWDLLNLAILGALNYMCAQYDFTSRVLRVKTVDDEYTIPDVYLRKDMDEEALYSIKFVSTEANALKLMLILTGKLSKDVVETTLRHVRQFKDDGDITHLRHIVQSNEDSLQPIFKMVVNL